MMIFHERHGSNIWTSWHFMHDMNWITILGLAAAFLDAGMFRPEHDVRQLRGRDQTIAPAVPGMAPKSMLISGAFP